MSAMTEPEPARSLALPSGGPVTLHGVSFDHYEALLLALGDDHPSLRMTYREGRGSESACSPYWGA